jgi:hypothetical protein
LKDEEQKWQHLVAMFEKACQHSPFGTKMWKSHILIILI